MSDVQSNVKPLTLTTGRVIFAIAGVYVTQSLVSALSMQSLPALVRAAGGSLALAGATTLFMLPWALKFIWAPWIERWRLPPGSQEKTPFPHVNPAWSGRASGDPDYCRSDWLV